MSGSSCAGSPSDDEAAAAATGGEPTKEAFRDIAIVVIRASKCVVSALGGGGSELKSNPSRSVDGVEGIAAGRFGAFSTEAFQRKHSPLPK